MKSNLASLIAFLLAMLGAVLLALYGRRLLGPDKAIFYLLILVPLAAASALILFKLLHSRAVLIGRYGGYKLQLAGPAVIFVLVIWAGYQFYQHPPFSKYNVAIKFETPSGQMVSGNATVSYESRMENMAVSNGLGSLNDVSPGATIKIVPQFSGYKHNVFSQELVNERDPVVLTLVPDTLQAESLLRLKTSLLSALSVFISNARDFSVILKRNLPRILAFDSTATDEPIAFFRLYDAAYRRMNAVSDSLGFLMHQYSPTVFEKMKRIKDDIFNVHNQIKSYYNDIVVTQVNNYITARKDDATTKATIIHDVNVFSVNVGSSLQTVEKNVEALRSEISIL